MATGFQQRFKGKGIFAQLWLATGGLFYESFQDGIVAATTQTQAAATLMTSEINRISVCATPGNGVKLPASAPGLSIMVINHGANPIQVYGLGADIVDDVVATTGVSQMQGSITFYMAAGTGNWYSEGLGTGYAGSFQTFSSSDALTATGANQAAAFPVTSMQNRFTTVAASTGARLPVAVAGMSVIIINAGANPLQVYGNGSDTVDGIAGATGIAIAANKSADFISTAAGAWHALKSA